jgi:hypothetical protein
MAMKEVAEATAPLRKMSHKNLEDYEADSLPYRETGMIKTYRSHASLCTNLFVSRIWGRFLFTV